MSVRRVRELVRHAVKEVFCLLPVSLLLLQETGRAPQQHRPVGVVAHTCRAALQNMSCARDIMSFQLKRAGEFKPGAGSGRVGEDELFKFRDEVSAVL